MEMDFENSEKPYVSSFDLLKRDRNREILIKAGIILTGLTLASFLIYKIKKDKDKKKDLLLKERQKKS